MDFLLIANFWTSSVSFAQTLYRINWVLKTATLGECANFYSNLGWTDFIKHHFQKHLFPRINYVATSSKHNVWQRRRLSRKTVLTKKISMYVFKKSPQCLKRSVYPWVLSICRINGPNKILIFDRNRLTASYTKRH